MTPSACRAPASGPRDRRRGHHSCEKIARAIVFDLKEAGDFELVEGSCHGTPFAAMAHARSIRFAALRAAATGAESRLKMARSVLFGLWILYLLICVFLFVNEDVHCMARSALLGLWLDSKK